LNVKKIEFGKGIWNTTVDSKFIWYNHLPHPTNPDGEYSLIITTPDETAKYYFDEKDYQAKLYDGNFVIWYTTKNPV